MKRIKILTLLMLVAITTSFFSQVVRILGLRAGHLNLKGQTMV